jgi:predicted nuclease of predicted toxin-antitoxin system
MYAITVRFLRTLGHEVLTVAQLDLSRAEDSDLLWVAQEQARIFVTRDKGFGGLVFGKELGTGVIYLRMSPSTQQAVHQALERALQEYSEEELRSAFIVVEPGRYRFRAVPHST